MSRPLVGLLIAVLATFVAAPSTSYASANALSAATASPIQGKSGTVVTLAVTYDGSHAATSVSASVGALGVALVRTSGTATSGRWTGVAVPPPGTWTVRFSTTVAQGNAPSLDGPTITILDGGPVTGGSPILGVASPPSEPIGDGASGNDGSGDGSTGTQAPVVTPAAMPAASPAANPVPPTTTQPGPATSAPAAPAMDGEAQLPSAGDPPPTRTSQAPEHDPMRAGPAPSAFDVAPSLRGTGSSSPVPAAELPGDETWTLPTVMTLAVTLASLLAIAGVGMLIAGRRRQEAAAVAGQGASASVADDPIVAAMGIAPEIALRARRARRLRDSMDERAAHGTGPTEIDAPLAPTRPTRPTRSTRSTSSTRSTRSTRSPSRRPPKR